MASASRGPTTTRRRRGIEPHDVERLADREAEAAALADGVVDDALVAAEHAAVEMDDLAGLRGAGPQPLDDVAVAPLRHEADVLAVGLVGDREAELAGERARLVLVAARRAESAAVASCSGVVANRK